MVEKERSTLAQRQIENPQLIPPASVSEFLFPKREINLVDFLSEIKPSPLVENELLILRVSKEFDQKPVRGFWLGREKQLEKGKVESKDIGEIIQSQDSERGIRKTPGIVLFIETGNLDEPEREAAVVSLASLLGRNGQIWILEKLDSSQKLSTIEKDARIGIFEELGLVDRRVVRVRNSEYILWYAREEKERKVKPIDLTTRPWFKRVLQKMINEYEAEGWDQVDPSEILETCRHSTFALRDYHNLVLGFGVRVRAHCGCTWEVGLNGIWTKLPGSHDEECEGVLLPFQKHPETKFKVGSNIPTGMVCRRSGCGRNLQFDRVIKGEKDGQVIVLSDLKCPSCGLISTREIKVPKGRIEKIG